MKKLFLLVALLCACNGLRAQSFIDVNVEDLESYNVYYYDVDEVRLHGGQNCTYHMWHLFGQPETNNSIVYITKTNGNMGVIQEYFGIGPEGSCSKDWFAIYLGSNFQHANVTDGFADYDTTYICGNYDGLVLHGFSNGFVFPNSGTVVPMPTGVVTRDTQGEWWSGGELNGHHFYFGASIPPTEPWPESTMLKCPGTHRLYAQNHPQDDYTYLWSTGATTPFIDITQLGTYSVTVTDACGNSISDEVTFIGEYPEHEPYLSEITYMCTGGTVTLDAGPGFSQYTWSNGSHNQTIIVNQLGEYWVQTVNEYGCDGIASTNVQYMVPQSIDESIPLVSIDTINMSNHIMISWSTSNPNIDEVTIYREALTNQWIEVGTADYLTGYFIDEVDGSERSYRYKLSAIDICGGQAELGRSYQSMNAAYLGPGVQYWWIQWTPYKVSDINAADYYELFSVDNLQDFNISPVDAPISYDNTLGFYYVNLPHGIQDSIFFVKAYIKSQYGGGTVMSNLMENYELLGMEEALQPSFNIYPNPTKGIFTVEGTGRLAVMNVLGQTVLTKEIDGKETLELPKGMYFVKLVDETRKLVVE